MQKTGGSSPHRILFPERKHFLEQSDLGQNQRLGDKSYEASVQIQKKRRRNMERTLCDDSEGGKDEMEEDEAPFLL